MSAARNEASRVLGAWAMCTRPMLTVVTNGRPFHEVQALHQLAQLLGDALGLVARAVFQQHAKFVAPSRAKVSPSRRPDCSTAQMCRSSSSPAAWPGVIDQLELVQVQEHQ